ncbi:uncharacterized protein LOC117317033 [Pecten maximus]|uniref:uncharacterized protein LOC117317033 n=1 Tax=Pecten maximus TaxID=6579 RepID=UPI0014590C5B|nr:uncharacterized protein LOC117317033 [Pecten maximus]
MASTVFVVIICCAVIGVSYSHVCLVSPAQRGSLQGINKKGADNCILLKPPCGGRVRQANRTVDLRVGQEYEVVFQKNLDHWKKTSPGFFEILLGQEGSNNYHAFVKIPDNGEPSLTLFTQTIVVPAVQWTNQDTILRVIYKTMNPDAPPAFYQCADVRILPQK